MGMEIKTSSLADWISTTQDKALLIPITLHTTSGSMLPAIRMEQDAVVVVPCTLSDVRIGDIVLIRTPSASAGVMLHRLFRMQNGQIVTLGDNLRRPDQAVAADALLGRAVSITGPKKNVDCDSRWSRFRGKLIVRTYRLRPIVFLARRGIRKLKRMIKHTKAHG